MASARVVFSIGEGRKKSRMPQFLRANALPLIGAKDGKRNRWSPLRGRGNDPVSVPKWSISAGSSLASAR
jgi:hypothetical protein